MEYIVVKSRRYENWFEEEGYSPRIVDLRTGDREVAERRVRELWAQGWDAWVARKDDAKIET